MQASDVRRDNERIALSAFVAANATVLGRVQIGEQSSVWFGTVIRGDTEEIEIGNRSNIQDLSVIHADPGFPCRIGNDVTIGHAAVVHGATIADAALIGIRAVVLNGAKVGSGALIGAGAVVTEGTEIPPNHLAVGVPARVLRPLDEDQMTRLKKTSQHYVDAAKCYREHGGK